MSYLFLLSMLCLPLYLIRIDFFILPTNVLEILALLAILSMLASKRRFFLEKISQLPKFPLVGILLVIFGTALSIFFNDNQLVGLGILKGWFLIPILFSFALTFTVDSTKDVENIFRIIFFSAALVGLISLFYKLSGIVTYDNRLNSFYLSPNHLAIYLSSCVFFGLYLLRDSCLKCNLSGKSFFYFAALLLLIAPLYYTYSYGAWIALFASLLITIFLLQPNKKGFVFSAIFLTALMGTLFFSQTDSQKFSDAWQLSSRSSFASRVTIWNSASVLIKNNPAAGIGPGNFQEAYLAIQPLFPPYLEWAVPQPHNLFLAFWLQSGLTGLVGFLCLLYYVFHALMELLKNKKNAALAAPLLGFFIYTVLHGLIDTTYWKNDLAFLFWICLFLTVGLDKLPGEESSKSDSV